VKKKKQDFYC